MKFKFGLAAITIFRSVVHRRRPDAAGARRYPRPRTPGPAAPITARHMSDTGEILTAAGNE
jgi:hypothetical protein